MMVLLLTLFLKRFYFFISSIRWHAVAVINVEFHAGAVINIKIKGIT